MRDVYHAMHDCEVRAVGAVETRDERSVDLEHVDRKLLQVCQGSIARPDVVERNREARGDPSWEERRVWHELVISGRTWCTPNNYTNKKKRNQLVLSRK